MIIAPLKAAAQDRRCYRVHGSRFIRYCSVSDGLPLNAYALSGVDRQAHWSSIERLMDSLISDFNANINQGLLFSGAAALHEVCCFDNADEISPKKIALLVARGARWDCKSTRAVDKVLVSGLDAD